jgi:hypothetical protein
MVERFELLVKDTDTIPKLRILDIFKAIQSSLVSIEGFLKVLNKEVTVTKSSPGWSVLRVNGNKLDVVLNGGLVLSSGGAILGKLVDSVDVNKIVSFSFSQVSLDVGGILDSNSALILLILFDCRSSNFIWSL